MEPIDPIKIAMAFVNAINSHDVERIISLMSDDHTFTDSVGASWQGKDTMRSAWTGYLNWFPNYEITIEESFCCDDTVALLGKTSGTYAVNGELLAENHWSGPAAWKAVVRDDKISHWQVYADNQPVSQILSRYQTS